MHVAAWISETVCQVNEGRCDMSDFVYIKLIRIMKNWKQSRSVVSCGWELTADCLRKTFWGIDSAKLKCVGYTTINLLETIELYINSGSYQ